VKPSEHQLEACNQFLGPTQPGVTTPDPTEGSAAAASEGDATATSERSAADAAAEFLLGP
jgi:hypothetical protein